MEFLAGLYTLLLVTICLLLAAVLANLSGASHQLPE